MRYQKAIYLIGLQWLALLLLLNISVTAQTLSVDSIRREPPRPFSVEKIEAYLADNEFDYPERGQVKVDLWSRFWQWLSQYFPKIEVNEEWAKIIKIGFYVLCALAIIYAVLRLLGIDASQLLGRTPKSQVQYIGATEDIHQIDFEQEVNQAVQQQNYRQAIRWCYLWALKKLSDQQQIDWHPGKTNHDYLTELRADSLRKKLSYLGYLHEYTWYGDFPADENLYRDAQQWVDELSPTQAV
ncbi:MAG: DUF4129 domain-containing protein [Bacteroidota bacterium]